MRLDWIEGIENARASNKRSQNDVEQARKCLLYRVLVYYLRRASLGIYCWSDISKPTRNRKVFPAAISMRSFQQKVTLQSFQQKKTWAKHHTPKWIKMGHSISTNVFSGLQTMSIMDLYHFHNKHPFSIFPTSVASRYCPTIIFVAVKRSWHHHPIGETTNNFQSSGIHQNPLIKKALKNWKTIEKLSDLLDLMVEP